MTRPFVTRATVVLGLTAAGVSASAEPERAPLVGVQVGTEVGARHLRYVDGLTSNLRTYDLAAAPLLGVAIESTPLDVRGVRAGVVASYARAFRVTSGPTGGDDIASQWWRFHVGLRGRLPLGSRVLAGASVVYGGETYGFAMSTLDAQVPSVAYRFVRPSVDVEVSFGRFGLAGGVGYDLMLSSGAIADRFPRASVGGVEAWLGPTLSIARAWSVAASMTYRRYFYDLRPEPGDAYVAGGALDEMYGIQGSVRYDY